MPNKNITDLPGGTFAAGHKFEMFNTLAVQNQSVTIPAQSVQTQNCVDATLGGNTAGVLALINSGTMTLAGGNNITLSQAGNAVTISAGAGGAAGTQTFGMSNLGNTSGTTGVATGTGIQFFLAGGNNVTLSQSLNGASGTITISAFNQSVQPEGTISFGMSNIGNTSGTTGVATGTGPLLVLAGGNNVTLSQSLNGASATVTISAFTQTVQTQNCVDATLAGNTSGALALISSGTMTLAGGNNITLSQAGNAVTISAFTQTVQTQNVVDVTLAGNTSGALALISSGTMTLAGGNNVTLSQAGNAVTISAGAGAAPTLSFFNNMHMNVSNVPINSAAFSFDSVGVFPLVPGGQVFPGNMTANTFNLLFSLSGSTATMSSAWTTSVFVGIYTFNASTLSLLNSVSTSVGTNAGNANLSTNIAGIRWVTINSSAWSAQPTFTAGHYWIATMVRSSGVSCQTGGFYGEAFWPNNVIISGSVGVNQVANTSVGFEPFLGGFSVSTAALPAAIQSNDLNKQLVMGTKIPTLVMNNLIASF